MQRAMVNLGIDDSAEDWEDIQRILNTLGIESMKEDGFSPLKNQALFIAEPKAWVEGELTEEE